MGFAGLSLAESIPIVVILVEQVVLHFLGCSFCWKCHPPIIETVSLSQIRVDFGRDVRPVLCILTDAGSLVRSLANVPHSHLSARVAGPKFVTCRSIIVEFLVMPVTPIRYLSPGSKARHQERSIERRDELSRCRVTSTRHSWRWRVFNLSATAAKIRLSLVVIGLGCRFESHA